MFGDTICLLTPKIMSRDAWKFNSTNGIRIVSLENKNLYIKGKNALFNNRSYLKETFPVSIQRWWVLWKQSILFFCGSGEAFNLFFGKGSKYICCQREREAKLRPCLARSLNKDLKKASLYDWQQIYLVVCQKKQIECFPWATRKQNALLSQGPPPLYGVWKRFFQVEPVIEQGIFPFYIWIFVWKNSLNKWLTLSCKSC